MNTALEAHANSQITSLSLIFPEINNFFMTNGGPVYLEISGDGAPADVNQLRHVIVGIKGPNTALEVEVLVELNGLGLSDVGVELVGAVISRTQRDAVIGHIVQETCLCGRMP